MKFGHIHLSILKPQAVKGKTWGFVRIEKIGGPEQHKQQPDHKVEVSLYVPGSLKSYALSNAWAKDSNDIESTFELAASN